ncbi:M1 family metallopeptidase [Aggregicoccus sp. 17bor-14]|uniref:M1 family metallopeptidase n=1 Tax=Myxococcaceae TaxID=31 RepID=UPI00129CF7E8|nr:MULTISPECIES: M1 family metallopeptidase [Myxococcaceae]MBF5042213.1 M1 family metallopeptidase [Simulacricoccus sp. 17bor-14]MRI87989.1 M1 family metallopeptidase [Aggregicoccus sp. 17bor-14]
MRLHARSRLVLALAVPLLALAGCRTAAPEATASQQPQSQPRIAHDPHSFARPEEARVTHVALDLGVDFAARTLKGSATLDLQVQPGASEVVLDTDGLRLRSVTDEGGKALPWTLGTAHPRLGQPLTVTLRPGTRRIVVRYETRPEAGALQWLTPAQTAGKQHPYLFSQGEAILTRTWVPTQDSPGIRQTYSARLTVPRGLRAVMSAEQLTPEGVPVDGGHTRFDFRMPQAIPPYLMAVAVGDIAFQQLGPRSGVYAEPSVLARAAYEFGEVEQMMAAAERLYGPYRWGRYDILVLPPSFPYGGMENPRLTFATPTVLSGDRSLVSLIAHELAHSWSGNLVTNATWSDSWLNEGVTSYFELRIMEALYGREVGAMLSRLSLQELERTEKEVGEQSPQTQLYVQLKGDPEEGGSRVIYEKGAAFLQTMEETVGRERFDAFLRSYFDRHAFQSMDTRGFLAEVREHLVKGDAALEQKLQLDEWVYRPGLPANVYRPQTDRFAHVEAQVKAFLGGAPASALKTQGWLTQEWQYFLGLLPRELTPAQLASLDGTFHFTQTGNSEVLFAWLEKTIASRYEPALPALEHFLTSQGRGRFVRPLYRALMDRDWGKPLAQRIYAEARTGYHPVVMGALDKMMN